MSSDEYMDNASTSSSNQMMQELLASNAKLNAKLDRLNEKLDRQDAKLDYTIYGKPIVDESGKWLTHLAMEVIRVDIKQTFKDIDVKFVNGKGKELYSAFYLSVNMDNSEQFSITWKPANKKTLKDWAKCKRETDHLHARTRVQTIKNNMTKKLYEYMNEDIPVLLGCEDWDQLKSVMKVANELREERNIEIHDNPLKHWHNGEITRERIGIMIKRLIDTLPTSYDDQYEEFEEDYYRKRERHIEQPLQEEIKAISFKRAKTLLKMK